MYPRECTQPAWRHARSRLDDSARLMGGECSEPVAGLGLARQLGSVLIHLMRDSRHRVENGDCTGVSLAGDCLTGCPDQDGVVDARQPTHGGAELVARSGHPGRVSSALGYRHGLVWVDVRPAAILARAVQQHDSGGAGVGQCPHVLAGCTDHEAVLVAAVLAAAPEREDGDHPRTILDYAREKLFDPLSISTRPAFSQPLPDLFAPQFAQAGFGWGTNPAGIQIGAFGLRLTAPDMMKIGELTDDPPEDPATTPAAAADKTSSCCRDRAR